MTRPQETDDNTRKMEVVFEEVLENGNDLPPDPNSERKNSYSLVSDDLL